MTDEDAVDTAAAIADRLGFSLSQSELETAVAAAEDLSETAEAIEATGPEFVDDREAVRLDDEYGSLLWAYEEPRTAGDGPLEHLDIALKDNVAAEGLPLTCGSEGLAFTPGFDATLVERLLDDGGTIVGKANMDAFAFGPSGEFSELETVLNPLDPERVPGGSSSGSGVAVASGQVDAAIGTDTGGSVRIPAACLGLVGIKPSRGAVSRHGIVPFAPSLDTAGPLARSVDDAARLFESIRGPDTRDASTGVPDRSTTAPNDPVTTDSLVAGVPSSFLDVCSETIRDRVRVARTELGSVATVQDVELPMGAIEEAYLLIGATEFSWWLRQSGTVRGIGTTYDEGWADGILDFLTSGGLSDHVAKRVLPSAYLDAIEDGAPYRAARREARAFADRVESALTDVDVLLVPTIRTLPPERGEVTANERLFDLLGNTAPFNLSGHPAVSIPVDAVDGLPVSVQVVAGYGQDDLAVEAADTFAEIVADSDTLAPPDLPP